MKLWESGASKEGSSDEQRLARSIERFTVGEDWRNDQKLVPWDCLGSVAHARMLGSIGILKPDEVCALERGLGEILALHAAGRFQIAPTDEDCHTAIENFLTASCGEAGKKIHTGRSRNDQVLTALKLFMKDALFETEDLALTLGTTLVDFAAANPVALPGYTHMQKAMPSTLELWALAFAESVLDCARLLAFLRNFLDRSPLGSAAGYGVALPIDREMTARLLGFGSVQRNVVLVQNYRGKNEALCLGGLMFLMSELGKVGADLLFMAQPELGFIELPERFCTGSSIMPQKKNPDVLELLRAKAKVLVSLHQQVISIVTDLPSGYHRDFQLTKQPLFEGFEITQSSLRILQALIPALTVRQERCEAALTPEVFATDLANQYVLQGMPFRDAYRKVKSELTSLRSDTVRHLLTSKTHTGAPGNTGLDQVRAELIQALQNMALAREKFTRTCQDLLAKPER